VSTNRAQTEGAGVDLYWLPLGAGDAPHLVRWSGRIYEALEARHEHRPSRDLYHSALEVQLGGNRFVIEMAPVWRNREAERGVVCEGAVGFPWLGHSRLFRYEVRRWRNGIIPDVSEAVASPRRLSASTIQAQHVLELVPAFPTVTWGRDELRTGDMWNSNSLISWLLARSGLDTDAVGPPVHGRAPGWSAGLVVASREADAARSQHGADSRPRPTPDSQGTSAAGGGRTATLLNRVVNPMTTVLLASPLHPIVSRGLVGIRYSGRRSRAPHRLVTGYVTADRAALVMVGRPETKTWWRNFQEPHPAWLLLRGDWQLNWGKLIPRGTTEWEHASAAYLAQRRSARRAMTTAELVAFTPDPGSREPG
jgi:hypothetical protein